MCGIAYGALTAFLNADGIVGDKRSHAGWVNALFWKWGHEGIDVPDKIKKDIIATLDLAAERALAQQHGDDKAPAE